MGLVKTGRISKPSADISRKHRTGLTNRRSSLTFAGWLQNQPSADISLKRRAGLANRRSSLTFAGWLSSHHDRVIVNYSFKTLKAKTLFAEESDASPQEGCACITNGRVVNGQ